MTKTPCCFIPEANVWCKQMTKYNPQLKSCTDSAYNSFVTSTTKMTNRTRRLASYRSEGAGDLAKHTKIWEAGRATSAAPSFFDPAKIGPFGETFLDGGAGANNPINELWNEAKNVWSSESLEAQLRCLISVGTGVPEVTGFGDYPHEMAAAIAAIATDTQRTAQEFHKRNSALDQDSTRVYFRFNVPSGLGKVGLEETKKKDLIATITRDYLAEDQQVLNQLRACTKLLQAKNGVSVRSTLLLSQQHDVDSHVEFS